MTLADIDGVELDSETTFADLTTLRIGGSPLVTVHCASSQAAIEALAVLDDASQDYLVVGGGSNLVVAEGPRDVVVVRLDFEDIDASVASGIVRAEAGAVWDDVVALSVECGLGGIECLSGIPGNAGAVPVQNVGAYGAETSDVLTQVYLYDRSTRTASWVPAADLELAYRYSNLKFTGRGVVLAIELQLTTDGLSKPLRFGQLTQTPGERRGVAEVRAQVLQLRRSKGMVRSTRKTTTRGRPAPSLPIPLWSPRWPIPFRSPSALPGATRMRTGCPDTRWVALRRRKGKSSPPPGSSSAPALPRATRAKGPVRGRPCPPSTPWR